MHELSIAQSILESVQREQDRQGWGAISSISLQIGALAGIHNDSLVFGFEALRSEFGMDACTLEIESLPITLACATCGTTAPTEELAFICSVCGSSDVSVTSGYELDIVSVDVAEQPVQS